MNDINFDIINEALELLSTAFDEPILVKLNRFDDYYYLEGIIQTTTTAKFKPFKLLFENDNDLHNYINSLLLEYEIYDLNQSISSDITPDFSNLKKYEELEHIFSPETIYDNLAQLQKKLIKFGLEKMSSSLFMDHPLGKTSKEGNLNLLSKYDPSFNTKNNRYTKVCIYELL